MLPSRSGFEQCGTSPAKRTERARWDCSGCWGWVVNRTAWAWLHKLRRAMVRPGRDRLRGRIEVDETFVGGEEDGVRGRRRGDKSLIVIAVEVVGKRVGRIRLRSIPDASAGSLHPFIRDSIEPGSIVHTDGWPGYKGLEEKGYSCEISVIGKQPK